MREQEEGVKGVTKKFNQTFLCVYEAVKAEKNRFIRMVPNCSCVSASQPASQSHSDVGPFCALARTLSHSKSGPPTSKTFVVSIVVVAAVLVVTAPCFAFDT